MASRDAVAQCPHRSLSLLVCPEGACSWAHTGLDQHFCVWLWRGTKLCPLLVLSSLPITELLELQLRPFQ